MLVHCLRRWPSIKLSLVQRIVVCWDPMLVVNAGSILVHLLRRWPSIKPSLLQCLLFDGYYLSSTAMYWPRAVLKLCHCLRRRPNINSARAHLIVSYQTSNRLLILRDVCCLATAANWTTSIVISHLVISVGLHAVKNDKRKYPGIIAHLDCDCPRDGRRATFGTMSFELWASAATPAHNSNNFVPHVARDVARAIALVCFALHGPVWRIVTLA